MTPKPNVRTMTIESRFSSFLKIYVELLALAGSDVLGARPLLPIDVCG